MESNDVSGSTKLRDPVVCAEPAASDASKIRIESHEFEDLLRRAWEVMNTRARIERQSQLTHR